MPRLTVEVFRPNHFHQLPEPRRYSPASVKVERRRATGGVIDHLGGSLSDVEDELLPGAMAALPLILACALSVGMENIARLHPDPFRVGI